MDLFDNIKVDPNPHVPTLAWLEKSLRNRRAEYEHFATRNLTTAAAKLADIRVLEKRIAQYPN